MEIINRPVADLKTYDQNARTHSVDQVNSLAESIKIYGFLDPIEIDKDLVIISGHARLAAAIQLGLTHVPTISHGHLNKSLRKGYTLAANRIAQSAGWDSQLVRNELIGLKNEDFDLRLTGFSEDEIDAYLNPDILNPGLGDEDDCSGTGQSKEPVTRKGDTWLLGNHRLRCGDSTLIGSFTDLTQGHHIDMAYCDPPYGVEIYTHRNKQRAKNLARKNKYEPMTGDDSTQAAIDAYGLCASMEIPVIIFWGGNYYSSALPDSSCWIVWDKNNSGCFADAELAWTNQKTAIRIFQHTWNGMIRESERNEKRVHPTQKPVALAEWCFNEYGKKAKIILDLFGGSGSTLIACEKTGRTCLMMEIDERYCDIIVQRWQKFTGRKAILEETGETFNG